MMMNFVMLYIFFAVFLPAVLDELVHAHFKHKRLTLVRVFVFVQCNVLLLHN